MTVQTFDHERLDVYRLSNDYVARSFEASHAPLRGYIVTRAINGFVLHNRSHETSPRATENAASKIVLDFSTSHAVLPWSVPRSRTYW